MLIERAVTETLESLFAERRALSIEERLVSTKAEKILWIGLSGGIDSTVLLHAAAQFAAMSSRKLKAIHIHHGLSKNADAWAEHAQTLCKELSEKFSIAIDCVVERVQLDDRSDGLEQAARSARYRIFTKHCGPNDVLLQGHHLDDQIETFFMRVIRGSGLTGLASIPKQRSLSRDNTCQILRPLLNIEKNQLLEYAKDHQLNWVEDESNQDSKIDRNWWRNELLPQIWQRYPEQKRSLSRTINTIQHEQSLLQSLLLASINDKTVLNTEQQPADMKIHPALKDIPSFNLLLIRELDQATSLSYLRAWLAQYVDILPSAIQMQTIYVDMILAGIDREPKVNWSSSALYRYNNCLYLIDNATFIGIGLDGVKLKSIEWQGEETDCFLGQLVCHEQVDSFGLIPAEYTLRNWQAGDVAKPAGRSTRKMKKWWQDYSVPSWAREHWPIIVDKETDKIAAVPGLFVCQGYCVEPGQSGWLIEYKVILK
ncbi:MAG: tRNA lysidine(34) synthetase TilS [Oleispira sp.]|nr:tRNA lysidine(34) synthetase TilS [Oleispira sp.]MBL4881664.1 tRNA lysidine(34) synthetase TilS [Oleispira sp.]